MPVVVFFLSLFLISNSYAEERTDKEIMKEIVSANLIIKDMVGCEAHIMYAMDTLNIHNAYLRFSNLEPNTAIKDKLSKDYEYIEEIILPRLRSVIHQVIDPRTLEAKEINHMNMVQRHLKNAQPIGPNPTIEYLGNIYGFIDKCIKNADELTEMFVPKRAEVKTPALVETPLPDVKD